MKKILLLAFCLIALAALAQYWYVPPAGTTPAYGMYTLASSTVSVPTGVGGLQIPWDTTVAQSGMTMNAGGAVTITTPGIYAIACGNGWSMSFGAFQGILIYKNGTQMYFTAMNGANSSGLQTTSQFSCMLNCAAGDTVSVWAWQFSGTAKTVQGSPTYTFFHIHRIPQ